MANFKVEKNNGVVTLHLEGKFNSEVADEVKKQITDLEANAKEIILDFKDLLYVSSAGLRAILETHKNMKANGKQLTLINVDPGNMDILESTGLTKFLNIRNEQ